MAKQPEYKGIVDVAGAVRQFLLNTSESDLIVELLQNELDARSSHTVLRVHNDRLVCEGNGRKIEAEGWKRLKFILAAGRRRRSEARRHRGEKSWPASVLDRQYHSRPIGWKAHAVNDAF